MKNMLLLIKNTFKVTFRKKGSFLIYLFLPLAGVLLSMVIYSGAGSSMLNVGVADGDKSSLSADFKSTIAGLNGYKVSDAAENDMNEKLLDKKLDAVIIIPKGYGESIYKNIPDKMRLVSVKGAESTAWLENYINLYTKNLADLSTASGGSRDTFRKIYAEYKANPLKLTEMKLPDQKTGMMMTMTSLGWLIMFVMLGAGMTSMFILEEKRSRTYYRICSAPVKPAEYIAGNAITSLAIVALQIILVLTAMKYVFKVETYVSEPVLFLILLLFGVVAVGISLLVTSFSSSSYMASTLSTLIITPTCMLGGCFWSVEYMPETMRKIAYFVPQRWALEAVQKLQTGSGFEGIAINLVILFAFAAAMILIAVYRFARSGNVERFV